MALDKIDTNIIADDAVTATKIPSGAVGISELATATGVETSHHKIPSVTTANLPGAGGGTNASVTAVNGMLVYNSTLGMLQQYSSGIWSAITTAPVISSFVYSDGASATAENTAGGGVITINGTNFDSTAAGSSANVGVTFGGTTATSISVNAGKTVITATVPAKSAGTVLLLITNASGLTAQTDFIYDAEPAWTATGALGSFYDGAFTNSSAETIRIQAAEGGDTITYAQTNSAGTVITTAIAGLTLGTSGANAGYLTGTLAGGSNTTYPFYAKATDAENQVTAPTLFNIISNPPNLTRPGDGPYATDSYTKLLIHSDTSNNSTTFTDSGTNTHTITRSGSMKHDTARNVIGATAILFNNAVSPADDWLILPNHADWQFGTGDFTIDFWCYPHSDGLQGYGGIMSWTTTSNTSVTLTNIRYEGTTNRMMLEGDGYSNLMTATTPEDTWTHLAVARSGTSLKWFKNGALDSTHTNSRNLTGAVSGMHVGSSWMGYNQHAWDGFMDEIRISKGIARWTSAFTVYP